MIGAPLLLFLLQQGSAAQGPAGHYAGGASSQTAGTTALAGQFFRFLLSTVPQWVQLAGIFIGVPVACILVWKAWKHRRRLWAWWVARSRVFQVAVVGASLVAAVFVGGTGLYGYNYVMHENDFCQSCHIMDIPWNRFQTTAHKKLQCHACHRQPMYVSSVELFWWVVERRMQVPPHDKVPTAVCSECHMQQGTDSTLTLVTLTAGHLVHLKSDSAALKNVECVACHGRDFHVFVPNNSSCAQSGCHVNIRVNLGAMSSKSFQHCITCHDYKSRIAPGSTVAQARAELAPKVLECTKCHAMSDKMRRYDLAADPHKGNCASCHDAHRQNEPKDAYKTCATAQCHASADTLTAFHRGLGRHALDECGACHQAHSWKVKGTDCLACHKTINQDRPAVRRVSTLIRPVAHRRSAARRATRSIVRFASLVRSPPPTPPPTPLPAPPQASGSASDSGFLHSRHKAMGCLECHGSATTHGGLKFKRPEGCIGCHHSTSQRLPCSTCHSAASLDAHLASAQPSVLTPTSASAATSTFRHSRHASVSCAECHGTAASPTGLKFARVGGCVGCHHAADQRTACSTCHAAASLNRFSVPVTFLISPRRDPVTRPIVFEHARHGAIECARCHAADAKRSVTTTCTSCHANHHEAAADCASCHPTARTGHDRTVHEGCSGSGCHTDARMAALTASRSMCITCHQEQRTHYPARECGPCHAVNASGMLRAVRPGHER